MTDLGRLLDPGSIAIAGLSTDETKHAGRVLSHLRRLGYAGRIWGVNPRLPQVDGVSMYASVADLPASPDLVVAAVPAAAAVEVVKSSAGAGAVVVLAGGFAEAGPEGAALQEQLARAASASGTRLLGPNSGGLIRPDRGLAATFLTCLDRPPNEIRSGPVALVTQSGGTGSFLHNLAASRGEGLAVSIATGNEADVQVGEAVDALSRLDDVRVVVAIIETLRDGAAFIAAVRGAHHRGKRVVACRIGTGTLGGTLLASHTGAMARPARVVQGVLAALGVGMAETPAEAYDIAMVMAQTDPVPGPRAGVVTHSGGTAILLADLGERAGLVLPPLGDQLRDRLEPLLDHGTTANPLDMGGIIGGPFRFARVVEELGASGEFDVVLAVSTAHPPAHTAQRVESLLALDMEVPVIHLWLAGDQASEGLRRLRGEGAAVTDEPRAAILALAALTQSTVRPSVSDTALIEGPLESWGLPLESGVVATTLEETVAAARQVGFPVVVKVEADRLAHRSDVGGVEVDLRNEAQVATAFSRVVAAVASAGWRVAGVRVQRYRPGLEVIVGAIVDDSFGPLVSVGMGGVFAEVFNDIVFAPAPVDVPSARKMIDLLRSRSVLDGLRGSPAADVEELARIVGVVSRGLVGSGLRVVELNPLIWDGAVWLAVDWFQAG